MILPKNLMTLAPTVKAFIDHLIDDPTRPGYHFAEPEGLGIPGDTNGAFYADGRYHLMYLYYHEELGHCWGHLSSIDLVHWRRRKDCLIAGKGARGCFSGGAFVDDDKTAYISFWDYVEAGDDHGGLRIASSRPPYDEWKVQKDYIVPCNEAGGICSLELNDAKVPVCAADPSNIWKKDGVYYLQAGNLLILNKYGRKEDSPKEYRGDWVDLFSSKDLKTWKYEHRFYERDLTNKWTDESEDDMCPSFLPLPVSKEGGQESGKYLQLFIAHNKGCQYYIGGYDRAKDLFIPQTHGRMSWTDSYYFAPEALVDGKGRQIMWVWFRDDIKEDYEENGWCGVFSLPRVLWLNIADNTLRMAPAPELEILRFNKKTFDPALLKDGQTLNGINGQSCEIELKAKISKGGKTGFRVRSHDTYAEYAEILYDDAKGVLIMDTTKCDKKSKPNREKAPFKLEKDEILTMRIFIDKSVAEVFVNDRQAIGRRAYPEHGGDLVKLVKGEGAEILSLTVWEMAESNGY